MTPADIDPYNPPASDLSAPVTEIVSRRDLVPRWIKVIGWIFIAIAVLILPVMLWAILAGENVMFELFGLEYSGSALNPFAFLLVTLYVFMGSTAYGLIFRKDWGVDGALANGYVGVALCVLTTLLSGGANIRLEPIIHFFYLRRLHAIRGKWKDAAP